MTIREWCIDYCISHGIAGARAAGIMDAFAKSSALNDRWNEMVDDYPSSVLISLASEIDAFVREWIEINDPEASYKGMFEQ